MSMPRIPGAGPLERFLQVRECAPGQVIFTAGQPAAGVWIVRDGRIELSVGGGRHRAVVHLLRPGDVDGDIQLLLGMPLPCTARALADARCLFLASAGFEHLLARAASPPGMLGRWQRNTT
jgi:CRP-like cAMP-binding protein